ncbi:MAG: hypothetical protein DI535_13610 [Citrobacter freundii]|nr:MAG: hypothetical protein DI535_13610 [Citrobacter freundii]
MKQDNLHALLASVIGHLHTPTAQDEQEFSKLTDLLGSTLLDEDPETVSNQEFSFQSSDIFFSQNISPKRLINIKDTVEKIRSKQEDGKELKVFVRDTPVRTTQLPGSKPAWAAGAKVIDTVGPIINADGRQIWFDFYRIEKLIALYIQGQAKPAILFKASFSSRIIKPTNPELTKQYTIVPGSVWIQAKLLTSGAPADRYCGLRVKSGSITLDTAPQMINNQLTIAANNNIQCKLELETITPPTVTASSDHGADARNATIELPGKFYFTANGTSRTINELDPINWKFYGQDGVSKWDGKQNSTYDTSLSRVLIPVKADTASFEIKECLSPLQTLSGQAAISNSWWGLSAAQLDIANPLEADGQGALVFQTAKGLSCTHNGQDGSESALIAPLFLIEPGRVSFTDQTSNTLGATQELTMWKDEYNPHGTSIQLTYLKSASIVYNTLAQGDEIYVTQVDADVRTDRPVKVNGEAVEVRTKSSMLMLAANATKNIFGLYDDNILWDHTLPGTKAPVIKPIALALENALFTVSPVNGCLLVGEADAEWKKLSKIKMLLTFGMFSYLPTLPDPYAANLGLLRSQFEGVRGTRAAAAAGAVQRRMWLWLICQVDAQKIDDTTDEVKVSFHFGNMPGDTSLQVITETKADEKPATGATTKNVSKAALKANVKAAITAEAKIVADDPGIIKTSVASKMLHPDAILAMKKAAVKSGEEVEGVTMQKMMAVNKRVPDYTKEWTDKFGQFENDAFALLDVSSNANQMGISFQYFPIGRMAMATTAVVDSNAQAANTSFPFQVKDMSVWSPGYFVRAFTVPQIAWEPVFNLTPPVQAMDPNAFFNYYPNDGGPTRIFNTNNQPVPLAPIPVVDHLIESFKNPKTQTFSFFTLPFGLKAVAIITKGGNETQKPELEKNAPKFNNNLIGGIQIKATAGNFGKNFPAEPSQNDSPMFGGYTLQLNNILDMNGTPNGTSTLGDSVSTIFNKNFWEDPFAFNIQKGVPVTRVDWSGYGSNMFSNWLSPNAVIAQTSQARFDVMMGRTAHEVIQVRSILYPWGIRVVRTITLFRTSSNYVYRVDSGWQAESEGLFDFRYKFLKIDKSESPVQKPYEIHPGVVRGLFNIKNIREDADVADFTSFNQIQSNTNIVVDGQEIHYTGAPFQQQVICRPVWFDADVEIENVVQGQHAGFIKDGIKTGRVACKKILGYVQLAPSGVPITPDQFAALLNGQGGSIGGEINCQVSLHATNQQMRINRFDINASVDKNGKPIFVAAIRGNVLLPKDGSWSMVQHAVGSGEVTPLPESVTVPVIRVGEWVEEKVVKAEDAVKSLVRIANPADIIRDVVADTINFGILQTTGTQKALFLTPAFANGIDQLMSKTPPLFADAYRLMTGNGIFPNIGDAVSNFGKVVPLLKGIDNAGNAVEAFKKNVLEDGGKKVFELLEIKAEKQAEAVVKQGMELLQKGANDLLDKAMKFDVPDFQIPLVDIDVLKIYIDYKTKPKKAPPSEYVNSRLNFDIDSFAGDMAKNWKSRLNNLAMVVDLGSFEGLMRIKGNFDSKKGKETGYEGQPGGAGEGGLPYPEIEFHDDLKPVIDLLQMLGELSAGDYKDVMQKGLKIAMSNAGEIWEYKFEATKELPLVRFPPTKALYEAPTTPLKLEASMGLGVYFNAALKVTTDLNQLLPTAGAFIQFHGGLSVMCVSLAAATVYAKGAVDLRIGANTQVGPTLDMKFGFGAEIVVGLPVVGNVSVLYMISVEMHIDSAVIRVTAGMLFRGHAELLGGLVGVTITIEAKGTIERTGGETNCSAQVTFAIDISIFLVIDISFSKTWGEDRQVA